MRPPEGEYAMHYIILCRSLTAAQQAERALRGAGIFASITKAPQSANPGGCTYGVKIGERNLERAKSALREAGVRSGKIYLLTERGRAREVLP